MVEISSRDKVMFPAADISKGELVDYYAAVAPVMLPHLVDRPLTLQRFPAGIHKKGFMQKNSPDYFPDYIERCPIGKNEGETIHPVIHDLEGLLYLTNQNTVTFHATMSRASHLFHPDRLVFDLDPTPGRVDEARQAAGIVREFLDQLGMASFPMTTGSKGFHVVTPLDESSTQDVASEVAQSIAVLATAHAPDLLTLEFQKKNRQDRVFLDWLRNAHTATAVVAWSVRPLPTAPVAMPIRWAELDTAQPDEWTIRDALERVGESMWDGFAESAVGLEVAQASLRDLLDEQGLALERFDRFRS